METETSRLNKICATRLGRKVQGDQEDQRLSLQTTFNLENEHLCTAKHLQACVAEKLRKLEEVAHKEKRVQ